MERLETVADKRTALLHISVFGRPTPELVMSSLIREAADIFHMEDDNLDTERLSELVTEIILSCNQIMEYFANVFSAPRKLYRIG